MYGSATTDKECAKVCAEEPQEQATDNLPKAPIGGNITETQFIWELSRVQSPVHYVPYYYTNQKKRTGVFKHLLGGTKEKRNHILACTACAQFDPEVWGGTNPNQKFWKGSLDFVIRTDLATYEANSIGWADQAHNAQAPSQSRWCPGKRLALALVSSFAERFRQEANDWQATQLKEGKYLKVPEELTTFQK